MDTTGKLGQGDKRLLSYSGRLLKSTFNHWLEDKAPQLGAALAYYTVFSLAPMVLLLLAVFGLIYGNSEVARREILQQLYSFLDRSSAKAVQDIAASASKPAASTVATVVGIAVALFGASGVFGQLQDALNIIWGVKPKPGKSLISFLRARFLSLAMVAGVCFLLLVSLTASAIITALGGYLEHLLPGGNVLAWTIHLTLDISIVTLLFAMIFKFLPDARLSWRAAVAFARQSMLYSLFARKQNYRRAPIGTRSEQTSLRNRAQLDSTRVSSRRFASLQATRSSAIFSTAAIAAVSLALGFRPHLHTHTS